MRPEPDIATLPVLDSVLPSGPSHWKDTAPLVGGDPGPSIMAEQVRAWLTPAVAGSAGKLTDVLKNVPAKQ